MLRVAVLETFFLSPRDLRKIFNIFVRPAHYPPSPDYYLRRRNPVNNYYRPLQGNPQDYYHAKDEYYSEDYRDSNFQYAEKRSPILKSSGNKHIPRPEENRYYSNKENNPNPNCYHNSYSEDYNYKKYDGNYENERIHKSSNIHHHQFIKHKGRKEEKKSDTSHKEEETLKYGPQEIKIKIEKEQDLSTHKKDYITGVLVTIPKIKYTEDLDDYFRDVGRNNKFISDLSHKQNDFFVPETSIYYQSPYYV